MLGATGQRRERYLSNALEHEYEALVGRLAELEQEIRRARAVAQAADTSGRSRAAQAQVSGSSSSATP